ncbi:MAG: PHP domain-containing protein [Methylococcales bacterium]|nr:PHP domain-containing protein [Methylococcales bacterium]
MTSVYDLHCHSTASDGLLSPTELVNRAARQGVTHLALTDHDTLQGQAEAQLACQAQGITFIPGIELSAGWRKLCVHIVGLHIDLDNPRLRQGCQALAIQRTERARLISTKLAKIGIPDAYESIQQHIGVSMPTRAHFAHFLLKQGHISQLQQAFDRYLGQGKPCYVNGEWPSLNEVVTWIHDAGGIAVLAHPLRYSLSKTQTRLLLTEFTVAGGQAIEVVTGQSNHDQIQTSAQWARRFNLAASQGSDFHHPDNIYVELGKLAAMPTDLKPVWLLHYNQ